MVQLEITRKDGSGIDIRFDDRQEALDWMKELEARGKASVVARYDVVDLKYSPHIGWYKEN